MSMPLTVILGGAKSGKTAHGLLLTTKAWQAKKSAKLIYIATAQSWDSEMDTKIAQHQTERSELPWQTVEEPINIADSVQQCSKNDVVLLDSIGMWVSNLLLAEQDISTAIDRLIQALDICRAECFFVADEVGQGVVPATKLGRVFRDANGKANQLLCQKANRVDFVTAGLVQSLKNTLSN